MKNEEKEKIIKNKILKYANENNGVINSTKCLTNSERTFLQHNYGGVVYYCQKIGVKTIRGGKENKKNKVKRHKPSRILPEPDLSKGIEVKDLKTTQSLCWRCKKSATKKENCCEWDYNLIMPKGAKYTVRKNKSKNNGHHKNYDIIHICECPLFEEIKR